MINKVLLVDGNSLAFRAWAASGTKLSFKGVNTGCVYMFLRDLRKEIVDHKVDAALVAWDRGRAKRKTVFATYKAKLPKTQEEEAKYQDYRRQMGELSLLLNNLNVYQASADGFEGDDVVWYFSKVFSVVGYSSVIVTLDRDLFQLVDEKISVKNIRGTSIDHKTFESVAGCKKKYFVELKAVCGDGSDGVPGIRGVGWKTAGKVAEVFDGISNLMHMSDEEVASRCVGLGKREQNAVIAIRTFADYERNLDLVDLDRAGKFLDYRELVKNYSVGILDGEMVRTHFANMGFTEFLSNFGNWIEPFKNLKYMDPEVSLALEGA